MGVAATGTVRINRTEKAPLKSGKEIQKLERGSSDVITESYSNISFLRWKDNKVVTVAFSLYCQSPKKQAPKYIMVEQILSYYKIFIRITMGWEEFTA